jgi:hypothetical protein
MSYRIAGIDVHIKSEPCVTRWVLVDLNPVYRRLLKMALEVARDRAADRPTGPRDGEFASPVPGCCAATGGGARFRREFATADLGRDRSTARPKGNRHMRRILNRKKVAARSTGEEHPSGELRPNLDRLTVGVDVGDHGCHYCILGLEGETLAEGQLRTTQEAN